MEDRLLQSVGLGHQDMVELSNHYGVISALEGRVSLAQGAMLDSLDSLDDRAEDSVFQDVSDKIQHVLGRLRELEELVKNRKRQINLAIEHKDKKRKMSELCPSCRAHVQKND